MAAKFRASRYDFPEQFSIENPIRSAQLSRIISLGQPATTIGNTHGTEMLYNYKFSKLAPLAIDACKAVVSTCNEIPRHRIAQLLVKELGQFYGQIPSIAADALGFR